LMTIELENGLRILTMTEPGIIGKVGFNSNGLGVCLNILRRDGPLDGLPVHIVLRAVLESPSFETARRRIRAAGGGKASNLLVGDAHGNSANFEFTADGVWEPATSGDWSFHTNHYQTKPVNPNRGSYECSFTRLETSQRLAGGGDGSRRQIIELLHDQSTDWPIHRCFTPHPEIGPLGTVATLLMDLPSRRLSVQRAALDGAKHAFHDCQL
ncbi:MAG: C45 family autoproteolytic acyltransferase/hydrolase, partial [Pirellulaceae bacterium]|nr:C45 family autoproteolytic acyltransferase/hydrolase [Pirellulaceae bacterium]